MFVPSVMLYNRVLMQIFSVFAQAVERKTRYFITKHYFKRRLRELNKLNFPSELAAEKLISAK